MSVALGHAARRGRSRSLRSALAKVAAPAAASGPQTIEGTFSKVGPGRPREAVIAGSVGGLRRGVGALGSAKLGYTILSS